MRARMGWAAALATALAVLPVAADTSNNGTFRFLTESLPDGSRNAEYVARILTANADGPVTFGAAGLPAGMSIDTQSGFLTGRPTETFNGNITVTAGDGTNNLSGPIHLKINSSGGGGNAGATFDVGTLPAGEVGLPYTTTLTVDNGVGPYTFGAVDLPAGISLDGQTGTISGTPLAPGTFYVSLSVYDAGENNKVVKVVPMVIDPSGSDFRFSTQFLNNGEVGTNYWHQWAVAGAPASVTFGASGLPDGLSVNGATGEVSGIPTTPGTFLVNLTASSGGLSITTNLTLVIVPGASSNLYWDFFGLPTGFLGVDYSRQPSIVVEAKGATGTLTYSAVGLPAGLSYSTTSGVVTGTPIEVGDFPVVFTATDSGSSAVITLSYDLVVLPATGGDPSDITVNLWVTKQAVKAGDAGHDSWVGSAVWNADRRAGAVFDGTVDAVLLQLGSDEVSGAAGTATGSPSNWTYATPRGDAPAVKIQVSPVKQTLKWTVKNATLSAAVPATLRHTTILGDRGYRLEEAFDENGAFKPALALRRKAFVCSKGTVAAGVAGKDSVKLTLLMGDPAFAYEIGVDTLRFRLLDGATELCNRDFTALGAGSTGTDPGTDATVYKLKAAKDPATENRIAKFTFASATGKMTLALSNLTLVGVPAGEAHLGLELTVGSQTYTTTVTFFEGTAGRYSTTMP